MPQPIKSPDADAIEAVLDAHPVTGTFEQRHPSRTGVTCGCGTRHPFDEHPAFPTHDRHLVVLINAHFGTHSGTREADAIARVMTQHSLVRSFTKGLPHHREVEQCRCGTQHPPTRDPRWATHRRHLAEQIALALAPYLTEPAR